MAKITIKGDTSGEVDIVAPDVAGSTTYNLSTVGGDILSTGDIGTTVQGYDADTAKYDDVTANFTGTLQVSGTAVVKSGDNISTLTNDAGYVTGNQTITLSGDLSGSGTTSINAQLGANVVNANELNVTGNGTTSQYLRSDGDGTFTWATPPDTTANQTITLSGDASGSGTTSINVTVADDSHNHVISNVDGLQTALNAKAPIASPTFTGTATTPNLQITSGALVKDVTGNYGSIEVDNGATGGYEGYSIGGRAVFMHNNSTTTGIYNDVNNQWIMRGVHGAQTSLYYNGAEKLQTSNTGVTVTGTCTATSFSGDGSSLTGISVTPTAVSGQANTATSYFDLPAGTTAQRPSSPSSGMVRHNTTTGEPEWYDSVNSQWVLFRQNPNEYDVEILMVAGGGAGGISLHGGGGGAGGAFIASTTYTVGESAKTITIGAGAANTATNPAVSGSNTSMTGITTAIGGGGGSSRSTTARNGGSGGGAGYSGTGGAGTSGQGFAGGVGVADGAQFYRGGGGGGASEAGFNGNNTGAGGDGIQFPTGSGTYYAGGGGGSVYNTSNVSLGGAGGGGNGANGYGATVIAENGDANTGGGGGGRERNSSAGGAGGSGIVIIRYAGSQKGTGGTITSSGGYTYHTFTSSGTYTP